MQTSEETSPIDCILFDAGGVLVKDVYDEIMTLLAKHAGVTLERFKALDRRNFHAFLCGTIDETKFWRNVNTELGRGGLHLNGKHPGKSPWGEAGRKTIRRNPFVADAAVTLKSLGYRLGVLSNAEMPLVAPFEKLCVHEEFDAVIYSCDVGCMKPDPRIYHYALKQLDATPASTLFFDDREENVAAARALGIRAHRYVDDNDFARIIQRELGIALP